MVLYIEISDVCILKKKKKIPEAAVYIRKFALELYGHSRSMWLLYDNIRTFQKLSPHLANIASKLHFKLRLL